MAAGASLAGLFAAPSFGVVISYTALLVERAREHCGCGALVSLIFVGGPGITLAMFTYIITISLVVPYNFVAGSNTTKGAMTFPDDGFEPDWTRRVMKVQIVALAAMVFAAVYAANSRGWA